MNILVVGAGMYVTGRGGYGPGVILASLLEASRELPLSKVTVAAIRSENESYLLETTQRLNQQMNVSVDVDFLALGRVGVASLGKGFLSQFDAAIVCVPDHFHYEVSKHLLGANLHLLVVKPFTSKFHEAQDLAKRASAANIFGMVEFHKRFDQANRYARKVIENNEIGTPLYSVVNYSQRRVMPMDIFKLWARDTNVSQYLAVHYIDLLWHLTQFRPRRVLAVGVKEYLLSQGIDTWDSIHATIEWETPSGGKFVSQFNSSWIDSNKSSAMSDQTLLIVGSNGRLDLDQKNRGVTLTTEQGGVNEVNPYFADFLPDLEDDLHFSGYGFECIKQFIGDVMGLASGSSNLEHLKTHRPSFQDALVSSAVLEAINNSLSDDGTWQEVPNASI